MHGCTVAFVLCMNHEAGGIRDSTAVYSTVSDGVAAGTTSVDWSSHGF